MEKPFFELMAERMKSKTVVDASVIAELKRDLVSAKMDNERLVAENDKLRRILEDIYKDHPGMEKRF